MKLRRLTLERYRGAAGVSVDFRPEARLHMVVGSNEAGKSTLLTGISDALFGFRKGALDFEIDYETKELLVGATVERDGEELAFTRRRGNKNTLLDAQGSAALADDALDPFLRGLSREDFERRWALDSHRLRQHARALIEGGDPAEALFEATSGLVTLAETMRALEGEAEEIFVSRGKKQRLLLLRNAYDEAAASERAAALSSRDLEASHRAVEMARALHDETKAALRGLRSQHARADLLNSLHEVYLDRRVVELALEDYPDLAGVPTGAVEPLRTLVDREREAKAGEAAAREGLERAEAALAGIELDPKAAERSDAIEALRDRAGEMRPYREDIPHRERDIRGLDETLDKLAQRIGLADRVALEAHRPDALALARIEAALDEGRELAVGLRALKGQVEEERQAFAAYDETPEPFDEREQAGIFAALEDEIASVAALPSARTEHDERSRALNRTLAASDPPVTDASVLARLPAETAVAQAVDRLALAESERETARRRLGEARDALAAAETAAGATATVDLPTAERIQAARGERDAALQRAAADPTGWAAAWRSVSAADALADQAGREAHTLAAHEAAQRALAGATARCDDAKAAAKQSDIAVEKQRAALADLFPVAIGAVSGAALLVWRREMRGFALEAEDLRRLAREIERLEKTASAVDAPLMAVANLLGGAPENLPVTTLARWIRTALDAAREARQAHAAVAGERKSAADRFDRRQRDLKAAETAFETWRTAFAGETKKSLGVGMSEAEARAALGVWNEANAALRARAEHSKRADDMRANLTSFEHRLSEELAELGVVKLKDADASLAALRDRAEAAALASARHRDALAEADRCHRLVADAAREVEAASLATAQAAEELGLAAIEPVLDRLAERDEHRLALKRFDEEMRRQLRGEPLADHLEALAGYELLEEQERIGELAQQLGTAEIDERDAHQALVDAERALAAISADGVADEHAFRGAGIAAEMQETAREWLVLKSAARMLRTAIARERASMSDPRIERATALFSVFTRGEYVALEQDLRSGDDPRLIVRSRSGEAKPVGSLSEGSVDQLFLAIKLAVVEDQSRRHGPRPFIGDDVLQSSDPKRAAAIVREMAKMGAAMQPILFTHHTDIAARAKVELGPDLDLIDLSAAEA